MITPLPGFPRYGIDEHCRPCSLNRRGEWNLLRPGGRVISLHRKNSQCTTITRQKFIFCCLKGIDPTTIRSNQILISKDLEVITPSERNLRTAAAARKPYPNAASKLANTRDLIEKCIAFLNGYPDDILEWLLNNRAAFCHYTAAHVGIPRDAALDAVYQAEEEFIAALHRGAVRDPETWMYKRCRGAALDIKRRSFRICDHPLLNKII